MRLVHVGIPLLASLSVLMVACRSSDATPPGASASAQPPAPLSAVASSSAAAPAPADSCARARRGCAPARPGPYVPPPSDAPEAGVAAPSPSAAPSAAPRKLGTIEDWVKAYQGQDSAENKRPPQLGVLADVPSLPATSLVYVRSAQIIRVDFPGGVEKRLTSGPSANSRPRWTRDARFIFFFSNREGGVEKIFRMRSDGSSVEAISKGIKSSGVGIEWDVADDGAHVAYVPGDTSGDSELHLVEVASKSDEVVYRDVQIGDPGFSRDGKTLFMVQGWYDVPRPGGEHPKTLRSLDVASRVITRLPNAGVTEITSPWDLGDGRLLFVASTDFSMAGREPRMHVMPSSGGAWADLNPLSAPAGYLHPRPSPDRKKIAVSSSMRQGGFGADWLQDIFLVPFEAGPARRLTADFPRPFYSAVEPTWATDSRHLAFVLSLCPYVGCDLTIRSVVLVDTASPSPKLAFVGYGGSPEIAPTTPR